MSDPYDLARFVEAQTDVYPRALGELEQGRKTSHWMWFVFPQIAGLGRSAMAQHYAIADIAEARAYLAHPVLAPRLVECATVTASWASRRSPLQIFGAVDAVKLRSSVTLFEAAGGDAIFAAVLERHCDGVRDAATLDLLARAGR